MRAGALRHRVTFERLVETQDSAGDMVRNWVPAFREPLWCEIMPMMGRELIAAQAIQAEVTGKIRMRYRPDIDAKMRCVHRGVIYNIKGVVPDPKSGIGWITLLTTEGTNDG